MKQHRRSCYILITMIFLCACNGVQRYSSTPNMIQPSSVINTPQPSPTQKIQATEIIPTPTDIPEENFSFGSLREHLNGRIIVYDGQLQEYQILYSDKIENLRIPSDEYPVFAGFSPSDMLAYAFNDPEFYLRDAGNTVRTVPINSHDVYNLLPEGAKIWGWRAMQWINQDLLYAQLLYTTEPDQEKELKFSIVLSLDGKLHEDLFISLPDRLFGSVMLYSPKLDQVVYAEMGTFLMKDVRNNEVLYTDKTFDNVSFSREGDLLEVMWSPDGAYVVYGNHGAFTLGIVLVDNKGNRQNISPKGYSYTGSCGFSWSYDSRYRLRNLFSVNSGQKYPRFFNIHWI